MNGHIVLAGGGHANCLALLQLAWLRRQKKTRGGKITLISEDEETPYSGMLPGYIAGHYRREQCFINLKRLAAAHGAAFVAARAAGISGNSLLLQDGRSVAFDVLSINTGAVQPAVMADDACAVKPIRPFIEWLLAMEAVGLPRRLAVIGGGAGGVETALALAHRWRAAAARCDLMLVAPQLLPQLPPAAQAHMRRELMLRGITLLSARAAGYADGELTLDDGRRLPCCRAVYSTAVEAAPWFAATGLSRDMHGFLRVNEYLQSPTSAAVYISGDAASHTPALPRSGVMAVRQAKILANNLPLAAGWRPLGPFARFKRYSKKTRALYIIGDGDARGALATRAGITLHGKWVWRWKEYLDFKFMRKFG